MAGRLYCRIKQVHKRKSRRYKSYWCGEIEVYTIYIRTMKHNLFFYDLIYCLFAIL